MNLVLKRRTERALPFVGCIEQSESHLEAKQKEVTSKTLTTVQLRHQLLLVKSSKCDQQGILDSIHSLLSSRSRFNHCTLVRILSRRWDFLRFVSNTPSSWSNVERSGYGFGWTAAGSFAIHTAMPASSRKS